MRTSNTIHSDRFTVIKRASIAAFALAAFLSAGPQTAFAQQNQFLHHKEYSLASLCGVYSMIGTYAANVAKGLGIIAFDGRGGASGSALVNQPGPNGTRTIVNVTFSGTYSVSSDGTGTISLTVNLPSGATQDVTEDFVITEAEFKDGVLVSTAMTDAQEQPSVVISGNVFVTHAYTRRPD